MTDISESARAVQELAKVANTGIEFVARLLGEPLEVASGMVTDRLRFVRAERLLRLRSSFEKKIKKLGITGDFRRLSPKLALPILEHASLEDDDVARLMGESAELCDRPCLRWIYSCRIHSILRQLEVIDVHILQAIYRCYGQRQGATLIYGVSDDSPRAIAISSRDVVDLKIKSTIFENSIDNLMRLRCIASFVETKFVHSDGGRQLFEMYDQVSFDHRYERICMTAFGVDFVEACLGKTDLSVRPVRETAI